ncbi:MAG TPA: FKBP-type peptidyl-prolyl cis-trans isomerase [Cyclobacteriaceae bacterium]|nr:FKBP-type peptidyl-prolyl cis-trans isomerase [Cyclobacteriaceae bacterium]HNU41182.1 FKBP-type peptidyl-prolyl cis-trans isomerase [Cyclobacteriaceae bacterium]
MRLFLSTFGLLALVSVMLSSCLNNEVPVNEAEEQWKADTTVIGAYIRANEIPALKDASGIYFNITELGSGFPPKSTSQVRFGYKVYIMGSTVVLDENDEALSDIMDLIPGMRIGLSLMPPGSVAELYVPSGYAYGTATLPTIPANSNLKFEVELISVTIPTSQLNQLGADTVALDQYLTTNSVENVIKDTTGLRYVITEEGDGAIPTLYNKVKINYTGKILSNGNTFFTGSNSPTPNFDSRVINYIHAFQAGLTKLKVGSKATLYVPSVLAFGDQPVTGNGGITIPANSNLLYEVELVEIIE